MQRNTRFVLLLLLGGTALDLVLVVDVSHSMSSSLSNVRSFLTDLLAHFTISTTDTQVALVTFALPAVLDWNLQSTQTADYNTLITNINAKLSTTTNIGGVNGGLQVVLNEVLGNYHSHDRYGAVDVVLVVGDSGTPPTSDQLEEMRQHAR